MNTFSENREWFEEGLTLAREDQARMLSARAQRLRVYINGLASPRVLFLLRMLRSTDDLAIKHSIRVIKAALGEIESRLAAVRTKRPGRGTSFADWLGRRRLLKEDAARLKRYDDVLLQQRLFDEKVRLFNFQHEADYQRFTCARLFSVLLPDSGETQEGMRRLLSDEPEEINPPLRYLVPKRGLLRGGHFGVASLDPYDELTIRWRSFEDQIDFPYDHFQPALNIEKLFLKTFECFVRRSSDYNAWNEDHITYKIIEYLNASQPFTIDYSTKVATVDLKVAKDRSLSGEKHPDMLLVVDLNVSGRIQSGVRYFEAKKSIGNHTYKQSSPDQFERILQYTKHVSMLAYDDEALFGAACMDAPLETIKRDARRLKLKAEDFRPFASALVQDYFMLKGMDTDESRVRGAKRQYYREMSRSGPRVVLATVTIDEGMKKAVTRRQELSESLSRSQGMRM